MGAAGGEEIVCPFLSAGDLLAVGTPPADQGVPQAAGPGRYSSGSVGERTRLQEEVRQFAEQTRNLPLFTKGSRADTG